MFAVGIDVAKEKSMVAILSDDGEIIKSPFEIPNTETGLSNLCEIIKGLDGDVYSVVEATGAYHFPIVSYLQEKSIFVSVINPLVIKKYASTDIRKVKTDKADALKLASYVLDKYKRLVEYKAEEDVYLELRVLSRQYLHYVKVLANAKVNLTDILDRTLPGIKPMLVSNSRMSGKDKLCDFVEKFWHRDVITSMSQSKFVSEYKKWTTKRDTTQTKQKLKAYTRMH